MAVQLVGSSNSGAVGISEKELEVLEAAGAEERAAQFGAVSGRVKGKC